MNAYLSLASLRLGIWYGKWTGGIKCGGMIPSLSSLSRLLAGIRESHDKTFLQIPRTKHKQQNVNCPQGIDLK